MARPAANQPQIVKTGRKGRQQISPHAIHGFSAANAHQFSLGRGAPLKRAAKMPVQGPVNPRIPQAKSLTAHHLLPNAAYRAAACVPCSA
jgi:hypothetical protein